MNQGGVLINGNLIYGHQIGIFRFRSSKGLYPIGFGDLSNLRFATKLGTTEMVTFLPWGGNLMFSLEASYLEGMVRGDGSQNGSRLTFQMLHW